MRIVWLILNNAPNASLIKSTLPPSTLISVNDVELENAESPIFATEFGIVIEVSNMQP